MKKKIIITISLTIFLHLLFLSGCENSGEKNTSVLPEKVLLGISMASMEEDAYSFIKEAMYDNKEKDNVEIIWYDASNSEEKQADNINLLIKKKVDIIIIQPVNCDTAGKLVEKIHQAKIPVLALDRIAYNVSLAGYVTADNFKAGMEQAEYVCSLLQNEGKLLILKGDKNTNVAHEITAGNREILNKKPNIQIIEAWHKNWSDKLAALTTRETLMKHPELKAIIANNSNMAVAALKVLEEKDLMDKIITIGADASKEACLAISRGDHEAEVDKMPYILGLAAYKIAVMIVREERWLYDQLYNNGEYKILVHKTPVMLINSYNLIRMEERWGNLEDK